jgi:hypothetical protein
VPCAPPQRHRAANGPALLTCRGRRWQQRRSGRVLPPAQRAELQAWPRTRFARKRGRQTTQLPRSAYSAKGALLLNML